MKFDLPRFLVDFIKKGKVKNRIPSFSAEIKGAEGGFFIVDASLIVILFSLALIAILLSLTLIVAAFGLLA